MNQTHAQIKETKFEATKRDIATRFPELTSREQLEILATMAYHGCGSLQEFLVKICTDLNKSGDAEEILSATFELIAEESQ